MRRILFAALLIPAAIFAQALQEEQRAKELLDAPALVEKAWGAYHAGRLHIPSLNTRLMERLTAAQSYRVAEPASEEHAYVLALFDALIESGSLVPADALLPFAENFRDDVLILFSRENAHENELLDMRGEKLNQAQWLAVNNLLLRMRSAHLFAKTVEELRITHQFMVVDHAGAGFGGGTGGGSVGCGVIRLPKGFPPIGLYQLVTFGEPGAVLVIGGPRPVYYRRTVVPTDKQMGWSVSDSPSDRQQERLEYLAALNHDPLSQAVQVFRPVSSIEWHDAAQFTREAEQHLSAQAFDIQQFMEKARQDGLGDLAGMQLRIIPEVEDHRGQAASSPPDVQAKEFVLE